MSEVVLDISRLMSRILHAAPTGIDRVELAYARQLAIRLGTGLDGRLAYAAYHPVLRRYGRLDLDAVKRLLDEYERRWKSEDAPNKADLLRLAIPHMRDLRPRRIPPPAGPRIYIQPSPHHLDDRARIHEILKRENAKLITVIHDLIPIEYPEFARPGGAERHGRRIVTILQESAGIITNSAATRESLLNLTMDDLPRPLIRPALLGTENFGRVEQFASGKSDKPYFVCIGTIEPRKNHLLLLNIWRAMASESGTDTMPKLMLIGRRGWENENIVDMLERCPAIRRHVEERGAVDDGEVASLLAGARGLLLPSFAEGYGMPAAEAHGMGIPVICSDLPALREASGGLADYLDPLDGPAWQRTIHNYAQPKSKMRAAQLGRLEGYAPPQWDKHFDVVMEMIEELSG